ncbi:ABC transporter substrate-binding protein [Aquamicrobium sp.]|uniref:ABC transporter substrate-binding protein n=1 Tax=Aquamicrobium sp. TaxID=1872579 RepID=UPI002585DDBD|nr:ABC transporter substrate-binding protein [Aquamicrobium sp.]MCK9551566.1 ABC transporter substrate-binding protein [Aquamicrobium sp.]
MSVRAGLRWLFAAALLVLASAPPVTATATGISITDQAGRRVTLAEPARRIVLSEGSDMIGLALIDPQPVARVVAWNLARIDADTMASFRATAPAIDAIAVLKGTWAGGFPVERVIALEPDLVLLHPYYANDRSVVDKLEAAGIAVAIIDIAPQIRAADPLEGLRLLAQLTGNSERAAGFFAFYETHVEKIRSRLAAAGPARRPRVLLEAHAGKGGCCASTGKSVGIGDLIEFAGGHNIGAEVIPGTIGELSAEYVLQADPDVYIGTGGAYLEASGGLVLGTGRAPEQALASLQAVVLRPVVRDLRAVAEGRVHGVWMPLNGALNIVVIDAFARWIHPDLFHDIDPASTLDEINRRFSALPIAGTYWISLDAGDQPPQQ